jgi:hypothetical protein
MNNFGYTIVTSFILRLSLSQVGHMLAENLSKLKKACQKANQAKPRSRSTTSKSCMPSEALAKQQNTTEQAFQVRQEKAPAILVAYKAWLEKSVQQVPPKSLLGKAIQYNLNQWDKLTVYLTDGQINIDNNRAERAIKPFVIGRKNWLFANTGNGAKSSAILYSLIETAKSQWAHPLRLPRETLRRTAKTEEHRQPRCPAAVEYHAYLGGNSRTLTFR